MNKIFLFALLSISIFLLDGCKPGPQFPNTPEITWNRFSQTSIQQLTGQIKLIFDFQDGDGDLGADENDSIPNLIIIDNRTEDTIFYRIPIIPQENRNFGITGEVEVDFSTVCCISTGCLPSPIPAIDSVTYRIRLQDQAGNWSNEVETTPLYINCHQ